MRNGAAVFCVLRTASRSCSRSSAASPASPPSSSLRKPGSCSSPSQAASRSGPSILPSALTSSGTAGESSIIRVSRRAVLRAARACRARLCAASTSHTAPNVQPASSRPSRTSATGDNSMRRQLLAAAGDAMGVSAVVGIVAGPAVAAQLADVRFGWKADDAPCSPPSCGSQPDPTCDARRCWPQRLLGWRRPPVAASEAECFDAEVTAHDRSTNSDRFPGV